MNGSHYEWTAEREVKWVWERDVTEWQKRINLVGIMQKKKEKEKEKEKIEIVMEESRFQFASYILLIDLVLSKHIMNPIKKKQKKTDI